MDKEELETLYTEIFSIEDAKKLTEKIIEDKEKEIKLEGRHSFSLGLWFGLTVGFLATTIFYIIITEVNL